MDFFEHLRVIDFVRFWIFRRPARSETGRASRFSKTAGSRFTES